MDMVVRSSLDMVDSSGLDMVNSSSMDMVYSSSMDMVYSSSMDMVVNSSLDMVNSSSMDMVDMAENCSLCNNSLCLSEERYEQYLYYTQVTNFEVSIILINSVLVLAGLGGNILVVLSVLTTSSLQTVVNMFLVNLAVADMLVLIFCAPFSILQDVTNTWLFGTVVCKVVIFTQTLSMAISVLTLTALAYDRYKAICQPLVALSCKKQRVILLLLAIWIISILISMPEAIILSAISVLKDKSLFPCVEEGIFWDLSSCVPSWSVSSSLVYTILKTLILYFIPGIFMIIVYTSIIKTLWKKNVTVLYEGHRHSLVSRTTSSLINRHRQLQETDTQLVISSNSAQEEKRKKAAIMLMVLVGIFFLANFPVHLFNILSLLPLHVIPASLHHMVGGIVAHGQLVGHTLCYVNSAINPFIFYTMSQAFKDQFQILLHCGCWKVKETEFGLEKVRISQSQSQLSRHSTSRKPTAVADL